MTEPQRNVSIKRAYEPRARGDGVRILVDRLWPRGLRKDVADLDQWRKELSPTTSLRRFYGHRPERFAEFSKRYEEELRGRDAAEAISEIARLSRRRRVTLLTASRDLEHSEAAVLATHLRALLATGSSRPASAHKR